jgi:hypothetical protein
MTSICKMRIIHSNSEILVYFGLPNEENVAISQFKKPKNNNLAILKSHNKTLIFSFSFYF